MRERPILFSAPMVRAILANQKTMTRRIMKPQPQYGLFEEPVWTCCANGVWADGYGCQPRCPYGVPGDRLWVRETWQSLCEHDALAPAAIPEGSDIQYPATYDGWASKHRPSIHMCRWMSRITLEITGVRIERLQAISEDDAREEGCGEHPVGSARGWFHDLWDAINGSQSWNANPWVWVVEFRRVEVTP